MRQCAVRQYWLFLNVLSILCCMPLLGTAATFHVSPTGIDSDTRNGASIGTAWHSLAYACERVPEGAHEIRLTAGTFVETKTSTPRSGISIVGNGKSGTDATIVKASPEWKLADIPIDYKQYSPANYLIAVKTWQMGFKERVHDVTINSIRFISTKEHLIDGALFFWDCDRITIHDVSVEDFRWAGMFFAFSKELDVYACDLTNANVEEHGHWSGNIQTHWIENSKFHELKSINNIKGNWGVGYKGGGHVGVKFYNSSFVGEGFSMEIMFENEYGIEIYGSTFSSPISIPKQLGDDPKSHGHEYTFWIHDNYMTSSYTIEGPRNHLIFDHNFIQISTNTNGRCYSQFGGDTQGPLLFHHNIIENVDRAFIWKGSGRLDSVKVYNNTVYCADAKDRSAAVLDSWGNMKGWDVKNNIFVAHTNRHRPLGDAANMNAKNNLCVNIDNVPAGNLTGLDPGLNLTGNKPYPYYAPKNAQSSVVDKGVDVGLPYKGKAPDIGAYEQGEATWIRSPAHARSIQMVSTRIRFDELSRRLYVLTPDKNASQNLSVRLFDSRGRLVRYETIPTSGTGSISLGGFAVGVYQAEISFGQQRVGTHGVTIR